MRALCHYRSLTAECSRHKGGGGSSESSSRERLVLRQCPTTLTQRATKTELSPAACSSSTNQHTATMTLDSPESSKDELSSPCLLERGNNENSLSEALQLKPVCRLKVPSRKGGLPKLPNALSKGKYHNVPQTIIGTLHNL